MIKVSIQDLECLFERDKMSKREREREVLLYLLLCGTVCKKEDTRSKDIFKMVDFIFAKGHRNEEF